MIPAASALLTPTPARRWIDLCLLLVFTMVVVGGLTRLTESGLSIVEWKLVSGTLPPLGHDAWIREFAAYRSSPQYRLINHGMSLGEFRHIFWLEYVHRLLGRMVGLAFFLPLVAFAFTRRAPAWLLKRMAFATALVGLQGGVGWLMVKSGLHDHPWVSPSRLALHLLLAVSLFGLLAATRCRILIETETEEERPVLPEKLLFYARLALVALLMQILLGAFVAGLRAGLIDNSFPLMDGRFVPPGMFPLHPWIANFQWDRLAENREAIQFFHRWWAFVAGSAVIVLSVAIFGTTKHRLLRRMATGAAGLVIVQIALGITTLLLAVPIPLGVLHQAVAVLLFGWSTGMVYVMSKARKSADFLTSKPRPFSPVQSFRNL